MSLESVDGGMVREMSAPQFGQHGMALRRGGGRAGIVSVIVVDMLGDQQAVVGSKVVERENSRFSMLGW